MENEVISACELIKVRTITCFVTNCKSKTNIYLFQEDVIFWIRFILAPLFGDKPSFTSFYSFPLID